MNDTLVMGILMMGVLLKIFAERHSCDGYSYDGCLAKTFIQGPRAFTHEQYLLSQSWPFDVETIKVPVTLWHGDNDHHVDVELAKRLAKAIPGTTLHEVDSFGHFLVYHKWRDILSQHINNLP